MYPKASLEKGTGWRQKLKILNFVNNLNPNFITSTNAAAIDRLAIAGIKSRLPIFIWKHTKLFYLQCSEKNHATCNIWNTLPNFPYHLLAHKTKELSQSLNLPINIHVMGIQREMKGLNRIKKCSK